MIISESFQKLLGEVANMVSLCWQQPDADKSRNGGYFCLMDDTTGEIVFVWKIGEIPDTPDPEFVTKANKYLYLAIEKAVRLRASNDLSSWASRNPDNGQWGGAVRTLRDKLGFILSFSGLPELHDEAVVLSTAIRRGIMSLEGATEIAKLSNNEMFFAMNRAA